MTRRNRHDEQAESCDSETRALLRAMHAELGGIKATLNEMCSLLKSLLSERELL